LDKSCGDLKVAVAAAITSPWSNGQTEGQITKLKLIQVRCMAAESSTSSRLASSTQHKPDITTHASKPKFDAD
jgi:hypothetical protein